MLELKEEDLVKKCEQCNGTGNRDKTGPNTFPECGYEPERNGSFKAPCDKCGGHARDLTPTGKVIRDFVYWLLKTNQIK